MAELAPIGNSMAEVLAQAAECIGRYEQSPGYERKERQRRMDAEREEREWLEAMCESAMAGVFGPQVREAAAFVLLDRDGNRRTDITSMRTAHPIIRDMWAKTGKRRYEPAGASRGRRAAE